MPVYLKVFLISLIVFVLSVYCIYSFKVRKCKDDYLIASFCFTIASLGG